MRKCIYKREEDKGCFNTGWIGLFFEIDEKRKSLTVPRQIVFVGRVILERETHLKFKLPAAIGDAN